MRFQKFTTVYPIFIHQFLADNPDYESLSYQELYRRFTYTRYGSADFYAKHLEALGHEAEDLFASFEPLQKAWAREKGIKYGEDTWLKDIVLAQVKAFQPDILYLQDLYLFDQDFRWQLRQVCNKRVIILGWRASPTPDFTIFKDLDLILTSAPNFVTLLQQNGARAVYMPLAFEHTILDVVKPTMERDLSFSFVGNLGSRNGYHSQRYAWIEKLVACTPLQVWGQVSDPRLRPRKDRILDKVSYEANRVLKSLGVSQSFRSKLPVVRRGVPWISDPSLPSVKQLYPHRFHEPVMGLKNYEILARSRIVFNSHIDCAGEYAGNLRLYEATGMGACLLTDWKVNLPDLFKPDVEVVTYRSVEECIEKVRYLLDHEEERQTIARSGQQRTLREHTYFHRVQELVNLIRRYL
ncbi:MAG TPA: glycosyltransferase [Candidatus Limnocylindrales bacterium]|nr:glycosyltransferase [Candidatus Limnocylindrales bacterium]